MSGMMGMMNELAPGTYYVVYTFTYPSGAETFASPPSARFHRHGGRHPASHVASLAPRHSGINLYLSDSSADLRLGDPLLHRDHRDNLQHDLPRAHKRGQTAGI